MQGSAVYLQKKGPIMVIGSAVAASLAYFYWKSNTPKSEQYTKELETIKKNIENAFSSSKYLIPLVIEQEIIRNEQGISFQIKILKTLLNKPNFGDEQKKDPFIRPFEKGVFIQRLGLTHNLLLNKFPVSPNHVLVVTKDFEYQSSSNTKTDLYQSYRVVQAMQGFAFFNSCCEAGASQPHKHIQVLDNLAFQQSDILKVISIFLKQHPEQNKQQQCFRLTIFKNIRHYIRPIEKVDDEQLLSSNIYEQYLNLLKDLSGKGFVTNESIVAMKYNLIITPTFMLIVERRKDKYKDSIGINGVGFTGSILVKNIQQLKELEDVRVVEVLEDVAEQMTPEENLNNRNLQKWIWI